MADLSTNYMDDILAESMNGKRKYRITRADGSFEEVTLEDISEYEQIGSVFGAGDINRTNQAVNDKFDSGDVVDPMETTVPGFAADALAVKNQFNEQNKKFDNTISSETITIPENDMYIAPCDGMVNISGNTSNTQYGHFSLVINNITVFMIQNTSTSSNTCVYAYKVYKGDAIKCTSGNGGSINYCNFIKKQ